MRALATLSRERSRSEFRLRPGYGGQVGFRAFGFPSDFGPSDFGFQPSDFDLRTLNVRWHKREGSGRRLPAAAA
jgi:hypothetical protein